jgi:hypothetical protein
MACSKNRRAALPSRWALAAALRWLPWPQQARDAVAALVEMLADDQACRGHDRRILAAALVRVGTAGPLPAGALPAGEHAVVARVRRLLEPAAPPPAWVPGVYLLAAMILASPAVLLAAPAMASGCATTARKEDAAGAP